MLLLVIRHKRRRQQYRGVDESLQPVKYQARPAAAKIQPQESVEISSNPAYGASSSKERLDEYEEVSKQEEYVEVNQQENLDEYVEVTQPQENLDEYVEVNQSQENLDEYVEVTQQPTEGECVYEEITEESLHQSGLDTDTYRVPVPMDDFLPKKDLGRQENGGRENGGRRENPDYVNDMDEIARELEKADLGSSSSSNSNNGGGQTGQTESYVNDLHTQVQRAQREAENEDEDGYTVYDPKRAAVVPREAPAVHNTGGIDAADADADTLRNTKEEWEEEEDLYENTIVHTDLVDTHGTGSEQAYVNDLERRVQEAELKEIERDQEVKVQSSKKVHHPYVNDVAQLVQELAEEEEGGARRDYVNDIASLLPSS